MAKNNNSWSVDWLTNSVTISSTSTSTYTSTSTTAYNINPDNIWTVYPQGYEAAKYTTEIMYTWDNLGGYFNRYLKKKVKFIQEEFDV